MILEYDFEPGSDVFVVTDNGAIMTGVVVQFTATQHKSGQTIVTDSTYLIKVNESNLNQFFDSTKVFIDLGLALQYVESTL